MKKELLSIMMALIAMIIPTNSWAQTVGDETTEPYAVLSQNNTVLTFYYDDQKDMRGGMPMFQDGYLTWGKYEQVVETVVFDPSFANCTSVSSTADWFFNFSNLKSITGLQYLNTENVTDMSSMFAGCSSLTSLDLSNFNTSNVTSMFGVFNGCSNLTSLDLSNFNTENVTDMGAMFLGCSNLISLNISSFNTSKVGNMESMFYTCSSLTSLDLSHFNTANVGSMEQMFQGCSGLISLNVSNFNTENVGNMYFMFEGCSNLRELDLGSFNTTNVTDMTNMFAGCSSLTSLNVSSFSTPSLIFMTQIFLDCSSLTSLDVSGFKTSNVRTMYGIFQNCSSLTSLDVSSLNTSIVTNMNYMFSGCSGLTSLDVSGFNTESASNMGYMFSGCSALTNLDVSNFKTDGVTYMANIFSGCSSLTSLDVSRFNTENVTNMYEMFRGCSNLSSLDLSGFKTEKVTHMSNMFDGCSNLKTIYAGSGWSTKNINYGTYLFRNCAILRGGAGTKYDASHTDHTYAHIDGGTANPGYFTAAGAEPWSGSEPIVVDLINNGDMEGDDNGNFYFRRILELNEALPQPISNNVGVNGSRGIRIETTERQENGYDNEFWISLNQPVSEGTRFKLTYDYRADQDARVYIGAHGPAFFGDFIWDWTEPYVYFETEWQTYTVEGTISSIVSSDQKPLGSLAFSLNDTPEANTYYFDNIKFEVIMEDQCPKPTFKRTDNNVTIQSPFDATIYFTVDGSTPTTDSQHFAGTVELSFSQDETRSATIKAIAVVEGYEASPVATYLYEPTDNNLDQRKEELMNKIYSLMQEVDVCNKELEIKDPDRTSNLWKNLNDIKTAIDDVASQTEDATTEEELDKCEDYISQIAYKLEELRKEIENYNPIHFSFDGLTAWVSGGATLDNAFAEAGGREEAAKTIAAIIWENTTALTTDMLQGISNPNLLVYVNEARLAPQGIQNVIINGQAKEIILTDATSGNNNFFCPQLFMAEKISYTRNFRQQTEIGISRGWEGIALPFDVQSITHETKGTITPFGSGNGKHFWLRAYDGENMYSAHEMEAYAPYVIAMPNSSAYYADYNLNGRVTFSATNTEVYETPDFSFLENEPNMQLMTIPAFQTKARTERVYAINVGQARGNHAEGSVFEQNLREVRPFEVYTVHNGQGARPRFIPIKNQTNGESTGIVSMENGEWRIENGELRMENDGWFGLDGRQIQGEPQKKGVYIQKGKKIMVK